MSQAFPYPHCLINSANPQTNGIIPTASVSQSLSAHTSVSEVSQEQSVEVEKRAYVTSHPSNYKASLSIYPTLHTSSSQSFSLKQGRESRLGIA